MRTIGRALLILATAALVAGALYLAAGNDSSGFPRDRRSGLERSEPDSADPGRLEAAQGPGEDSYRRNPRERGFSRGGHHDREGVSLGRGLAGVLRSLIVISLITLVATRTRIRRLVGLD